MFWFFLFRTYQSQITQLLREMNFEIIIRVFAALRDNSVRLTNRDSYLLVRSFSSSDELGILINTDLVSWKTLLVLPVRRPPSLRSCWDHELSLTATKCGIYTESIFNKITGYYFFDLHFDFHFVDVQTNWFIERLISWKPKTNCFILHDVKKWFFALKMRLAQSVTKCFNKIGHLMGTINWKNYKIWKFQSIVKFSKERNCMKMTKRACWITEIHLLKLI